MTLHAPVILNSHQLTTNVFFSYNLAIILFLTILCHWIIFKFTLPHTFFLLCLAAYRILVSWPGIEPRPLVVKAQNPNHWTTREIPSLSPFWWWVNKYRTILVSFIIYSRIQSSVHSFIYKVFILQQVVGWAQHVLSILQTLGEKITLGTS